jgi:hypothetical protein
MSRFTPALVSALIVITGLSTAAANGDGPSPLKLAIRRNMEAGTFFPVVAGSGNPLVFEAKVCPYYAISWGERQSALVFVFKSIVRMSREPSVPVRTPSYMPRFIYYNYGQTRDDGVSDFYYIMASHHSNGQEGSFFNADGSVNYENGSFSTNYVEFGFYRYRRPEVWGKFWRRFHGGAAVQIHVDLGRDKGLEILDYGFYRLKYWNQLDLWKGAQMSLDSFVILGPLYDADVWDYKRLGLEVSIRQNWDLLEGFDLLLSCYVGQDYYNIHYPEYLRTIRLGLVTDLGPTSSRMGPFNTLPASSEH